MSATNNDIYVGYFDGVVNDYHLYQLTYTQEQTDMSPALAVDFGDLAIGFKGNTNNFLYFKESSNGYNWTTNILYYHTTTDTTSGGIGIAEFCPPGIGSSCGLWTSWPGTNPDSNGNVPIYTAFVNFNTRSFDNHEGHDNNKTIEGFATDLAATDQGGFIYVPYSNALQGNQVAVVESQNATNWGETHILGSGADYGVSGTIQPNNLMSMNWEDFAGNIWYVTDYNFAPSKV